MDIKDEKTSKNALIIIGAAVVLVGLILYFTIDILNIRWPSRNKDTSTAPVEIYEPIKVETEEPAQDKKMVKDVVCGNLVDANTTKFYSKFLDYTFYFDTEVCLKKFEEDPMKYLPGKVKVKIKLKDEPKETIVRYAPHPPIVKSQPRQKVKQIEIEDVPVGVGEYPPGTVEVAPDN